MKIIGIVGRAYYNKDNQKIIQINEDIRKVFSKYDDVVTISLLPTGSDYYIENEPGYDTISEKEKVKLNYLLDKCDAFVVPGGTYWYNFDEYIVDYAIKTDKPLLAICLGFQCLCSMYALKRDKFDMTKRLSSDSHYGDAKKYIHSINIKNDTKLKNIMQSDTIPVNSLHHDYVDFSLKDLIISAKDENDIVEAVEMKDKRFIVGVQWHPEYLMDSYSTKLFDAFILSI